MGDGERSGVLDGSTVDLIRRLINDANGLIELQIQLAKLEAKENLLTALGGAKTLGIAAGLAVLTLIGLVVFVIAGLAALSRLAGVPYLGEWFWSLVLTLGTGAVAGFLGWRGIKKLKISPMARTRETLREDLEWLQQPMKRDGS